MPIRRFALIACTALTLSAAFAAPPDDAKCPARPGAGMFPPEARLMMFADMKAQADNGVDLKTMRQMQRDKMMAMTPDQRKAYIDKLVARFNALPPAEQKTLKTEAEAFRAAHPRPEGGPDGRPGGRADCGPPRD